MTDDLIPVSKIRDLFAWWPYKAEGTYRRIQLKRLGCVRVGLTVYVTEQLLRSFVALYTEVTK